MIGLLRSLFAPPPDALDVAEAGREAVNEARRLWAMDIRDPRRDDHTADADRCRAVIDEMIRGPLGLGWTWERPYDGDLAFEWCGAFAARCWPLPLATRRTYFASTYRLDRWGRYLPALGERIKPRPPTGKRSIWDLDGRLPTGCVPQAGDILLVGDGKPGYGDHVTLVECYDPVRAAFLTYEGNGIGLGPDDKRRQGIVRGIRPLAATGDRYRAMRLIRPGASDLVR